MRYFEERFLPDFCYPQEAVLWRALGRLPSLVMGDGEGDARSDFNEGSPVAYWSYGYSRKEFESHEILVDQGRYLEAQSITKEIHLRALELEDLSDKQRAYHLSELQEVEWQRSVDRQMEAILEAHRASIFEAVASGRLEAFGYLIPRDVEEGTAEWPDVLQEPIPRNAWTMRGFDWDECKLSLHDQSVYRCVVVDTAGVFKLWPFPALTALNKSVILVGEYTAILDDDHIGSPSSSSAPKVTAGASAGRQHIPGRGAGRRPRGNFAVRDIVVNYFKDQVPPQGAELPKQLVSEVQTFIERVCGETVPRSTVLDHLNHARRAAATERSLLGHD